MGKNAVLAVAVTLLLLLLAPGALSTAYQITLMLDKPAYGPGERIEVYGTLLSGSTPLNGTNITLHIVSANGSTIYNLTTSSDGAFYSRSSYYTTATLVSAPTTSGYYNVTAEYLGTNSSVMISVVPSSVNNIILNMDKGSYYAGQSISLRIETKNGDTPVGSISVNGSITDSSDAVVSGSAFSCTTNANGVCTVSLTAPSSSGQYFIKTNDGLGFSVFWVNPFDASVTIKDSTATTNTYVFKRGGTGYVNALVTYNSTTATGTYTATGTIQNENGTAIYTLSSATLNQNNSYSANMPFSVDSSFTTGSYKAAVSIAQSGGETVTRYSAYFEVRDWTLSVEKPSANSGFEYGYTAFSNKTVMLEALPVDKSTSNTITGLESSFNISLKNNFGIEVANATAAYQSSCSCYKFNFTTPASVGAYTLAVSVYYNETQKVEKTISIVNATGTAQTTDAAGSRRIAYTKEYIYIKPALANSSNSSFEPNDAEIISVIYENGTTYSYTNVSNWSVVNMSNSALEWSWNYTSRMIKMDAPDIGGMYMVELYVNNRSSRAVTKFIKKPYMIRASFKNSEDTSVTNDYWWQFKTTDTVYAHLAIVETDVNSVQNLTSSGNGSVSSMWGIGSAPTMNSNTETAVANATIAVRVYHAETGKEETLNTTVSLCKTTGTTGKYICTLQQVDKAWTGGSHRVEFTVTSADGKTQDKGDGSFEARAFYVYGWSQNWRNKPNASITLNVNAYVAGTGWWSSRSSGGVAGTLALEKVEYMGTGDYWMRSPVKYDYNTSGMNATTLSGGQGTLTLNASRAPSGQWKSGSYTAFVKITETSSGTIDYGRIWFEVRNWDVYSQPVEVSGGNIQYRWEFNNYENASLYVIINNAGEWGQSGQSLGGNVTIGVKSIQNYIRWPPKEMNSSEFSYNNITLNATNAYFWGGAQSVANYGRYIINISPASGKWDSGYYSVMLDVNGTESGYGWFSAIAFYVNAQPVDANGTQTYSTRGKGPLYFDITTTKNNRWGNSYSATDYVNTTIREVTLRRWDPNTYQQYEYKYPADLNISVVNYSTRTINGTGRLNITLANNSNWSSGYYNGEIILEDANGSKGNGWLWIEVKPFRVHFGNENQWSSPTVGAEENLTGLLSIYQPGWSAWTLLNGNYTIDNITQEEWSMSGRTLVSLANYTPSASQTFRNTTNITVQPNTGGWTGSYTWKNLKPVVRETTDNSSETGYISFRVIPALISMSTTSGWNTPLTSNVTVNITVTSPGNTSSASALNLTYIEEWVWDPSAYMSSYKTYNFTVGSCNSAQTGANGCVINSTPSNGSTIPIPVSVTIQPPSGGWSEGYHYPNAIFSRTNQRTSYYQWDICNWNSGCSINFRAAEPITGYMYSLNWQNNATSNITMYLGSLRYLNNSVATVSVTSVKYAKQVGNCWSDSCRIYSNAVFNVSNYNGVPTGNSQISDSGYVTLVPPSGGWEVGEYNVKMTIQAGGYSATIKDGSFRVVDMSPLYIVITSPTVNQTINATTTGSFVIRATTNKNARCYANILNYDQYWTWGYCTGSNQSNIGRICNNVSYNGSFYYYKYMTAWCYEGANCMSTGGTTHTYTQSTEDMPNQNYTIHMNCYDDSWNWAANATVFGINGSVIANTPPKWLNPSANNTRAGNSTSFYTNWTDFYSGLSGYIFSTNNTGPWANDTWTRFNGTYASSNVTKTLNTTIGISIGWMFYANNTNNRWNSTAVQNITVTA